MDSRRKRTATVAKQAPVLSNEWSGHAVGLNRRIPLPDARAMTTAYYSHSSCPLHDMGSGHPESPARLVAVEKGMGVVGVDRQVARREAPQAPLDAIKRVHNPRYVNELMMFAPTRGSLRLDDDTSMNRHSLKAALHSAGAVVAATDAVIADAIPAGTIYVPGSLKLDGAAVSDTGDGDAGVFDGQRVSVRLGNVASPAVRTVSFQVRID